jgi:hypothetical protein
MHARHYSPALGRFIQPDPEAAEANLYGYVGQNPLTRSDARGDCAMVGAANPIDWTLRGLTCVGEGALDFGKASVGVSLRVGGLILTLPFLLAGDTVQPRPKDVIRTNLRRRPFLPPVTSKTCWVIGELQSRVVAFALLNNCDFMPSLPGDSAFHLWANLVWVLAEMGQKKHLYDLGPLGFGSKYYKMERTLTRYYWPRTSLPGWQINRWGPS